MDVRPWPCRLVTCLAPAWLLLGACASGPAPSAAPASSSPAGVPAPARAPGDPARGARLVADRTQSLCVLCHRVPGVPEAQQGTLAPDLAGVGRRLDADALRERLRAPQRFNPETVMPAYGPQPPLPAAEVARRRVAPAWRDRPLLDAQQLEDVVAWLAQQR